MNKHVFVSSTVKLIFIFQLCMASVNAQHQQQDSSRYLFLGHIYDWTIPAGNRVDERIEKMDKSAYDGFWLGGDVCANTSLDPTTFTYLDNLFQLKNPNTHFVLGNHDYRDNNLDLYFKATGRPDYYTHSIKNIVISIINTNLNSSDCPNLNAQYRMLENVLDTINEASHYVLLMHHQIFSNIPGLDGFKSNGVCEYYSMNCSFANSYFNRTIYPRLVELENKGIEVVVVLGDTGWHKGSEKKSKDGIDFLASGINNSYYRKHKNKEAKINPDLVLEFLLLPYKRTLTWEFKPLDSLVDSED